jgi:hypothetical protein
VTHSRRTEAALHNHSLRRDRPMPLRMPAKSPLVVRQSPDRKEVAPDVRAMIDRALAERGARRQ